MSGEGKRAKALSGVGREERHGHRLALPSRAEQVVEQREAQGQAGGCLARTPREAQAVPKEG